MGYRKWSWAAYAYLLVTLSALFFSSLLIPQNGWDLLGHLGSAISIGNADPVDVHQVTYEIARNTLKPDVIADLIDGSDIRRTWADDARAFNQLLPMYQPRVILTHLTYAAYKIGVNPILAMRLISSISVTIGLFFLLLAFRGKLHNNAVLFIPMLLLLGGALEVARFEGADALAFLVFSLSIYFLEKRHQLGFLFLAILPATRSDMVILTVLVLPYAFLIFRPRLLFIVVYSAAPLVIYTLCNGMYGNYGWSKQFYVALIQYLAYPADSETLVTPFLYIKAFSSGMVDLIYRKMFLFFVMGFGVVSIYLYTQHTKNSETNEDTHVIYWLTLISGLFVFAHFIIFPSMNPRYFGGQYTLTALCALCILQHAFFNTKSN